MGVSVSVWGKKGRWGGGRFSNEIGKDGKKGKCLVKDQMSSMGA